MSKTIENLKNGNYSVVDNQGVSVTEHFIDCLEKELADLESKLAESEEQRQHLKDWLDNEILTSVDHESYYATINEYEEEVKKLKQQLDEKDRLLREKIGSLKTTDFIRLCLDCGFMVDAKDKDNQDKISFAVDILEELADCSNYINSKLDFECGSYVSEKAIRDKIKYLKGNKDE